MRIDVEKVLLIGPTSKKRSFFSQLQKLGIVELVSKKSSIQKPTEIQQYIDALHILRQMVPVKQAFSYDFRDATVIAQQVIDLNSRLEQHKERMRILQIEKKRVEPFGHFSIEELNQLEQKMGRKIQFFVGKSAKSNEYHKRAELVFLGTSAEMDYFIAFNKESTSYEGLIEVIVERSLSDIEIQYAEAVKEVDEISIQLSVLAHQKKNTGKWFD